MPTLDELNSLMERGFPIPTTLKDADFVSLYATILGQTVAEMEGALTLDEPLVQHKLRNRVKEILYASDVDDQLRQAIRPAMGRADAKSTQAARLRSACYPSSDADGLSLREIETVLEPAFGFYVSHLLVWQTNAPVIAVCQAHILPLTAYHEMDGPCLGVFLLALPPPRANSVALESHAAALAAPFCLIKKNREPPTIHDPGLSKRGRRATEFIPGADLVAQDADEQQGMQEASRVQGFRHALYRPIGFVWLDRGLFLRYVTPKVALTFAPALEAPV